MQYLVTDIRTLVSTWTEAASAREALIAHENAWRAAAGKQILPASTKASHYGEGAIVDVSLGESAIRGRRENVTKA